MSDNATQNQEEIFSKVLRAGRRTYFFDVRATKANDFYLTITESKKHEAQNGESYYKKHKIYLYKEDFERFSDIMTEVMSFIVGEKGEEVISDRHNPDFKKSYEEGESDKEAIELEPLNGIKRDTSSFTDLDFDEI
jgi:hypothetical protein